MEEIKVLNETQEEMQEEAFKSGPVNYIDSREVAKMVGKEHKELLRDIRRYVKQLGESKIALTDFFTESIYTTGQNKEMPCYMVTKKGCEFIAHKLTGQKGAVFTATYINRFHEMADTLEKQEITTMYQFVKDQMEFTKAVMEKLNDITATGRAVNQEQNLIFGNPFNPGKVDTKDRMKRLNSLLDQTSELCNIDRNKILHFMYEELQNRLNINLQPYLEVMKFETGDNDICNLHVIVAIDRFYKEAVEMNEWVIERKKVYG